MPLLEQTARGRPNQYAAVARDFSTAAVTLFISTDGDISQVERSFYSTVGHAVEVAFKAMLSHYGRSEDHLMMVGHNLCAIAVDAVGRGAFDGTAPEPVEQLVTALQDGHSMNTFRYPLAVASVEAPSPAEALSALRTLLEEMERVVGSDEPDRR